MTKASTISPAMSRHRPSAFQTWGCVDGADVEHSIWNVEGQRSFCLALQVHRLRQRKFVAKVMALDCWLSPVRAGWADFDSGSPQNVTEPSKPFLKNYSVICHSIGGLREFRFGLRCDKFIQIEHILLESLRFSLSFNQFQS